MYLQITTKCNMKCDHCCFKCEPGKGEHMSRQVFDAAIDMFGQTSYTIGGGEPTLHPDFEYILLTTMANSECEIPPCIITNGTHKKRALFLHKLHQNNHISAHLSTDSYHDYNMVSDEVYDAFGYNDWDINRNIAGPALVGRWADMNGVKPRGCACEDQLIQTDGKIRLCGCLDAPIIGDVWEGIIYNYAYYSGCFRDVDKDLINET